MLLYTFSFILSFGLTFYYLKWARKRSILDIPNERSSHKTPTPRGGGIAFVITFYSSLSFLFLNGQIEKYLFFALFPGLILAIVGVLDDFVRLEPQIRFIAQIMCSGIALFFLDGFHAFGGQNLKWFLSPIALIGLVWFINLFNFMDGSDGYASMEAISISVALWIFTGMHIILILAFSVAGFIYWNWPKAKIFMGDSGSTTLGFIIGVIGIYFHNNDILNFVIWILITALFWFDATITLFHRIINKEKLSQAHKNHIYQRAIQGGFSHLKTILAGLFINFILFIICLTILKNHIPLLPGFILALLVLIFAMRFVDRMFAFKKY